VRLRSHEKRLLASSFLSFFLSVRLSVSSSVRLSVCGPFVCLSTLVYQLGSQWMNFREILYWEILLKSEKNVQFSYKSATSQEGLFSFIFLTADICCSTIQRELIFAFPWQKELCERMQCIAKRTFAVFLDSITLSAGNPILQYYSGRTRWKA
jgi:hypothetical protein